MKAVVPAAVQQVCKTLRSHGFEAWIVGGAVRDLVLGKMPGDWDVASDALPEKVLELFDKTIATGLQHGTVTAVVGRGATRQNVEITTFRGEGAYSDSRRPDEVSFGVPLDEDLKRRDFVINAMAFDPVDGHVHDPFGGVEDIQAKRLRAVGNASERFNEDGLRVMRAVRFVSTLDFHLEPETESGMGTALDALAMVAQERVRVELIKLLAGAGAKRALLIAQRAGVLAVILPELSTLDIEDALSRVEHAGADPIVAFGALLAGLEASALETLLRRLTMSNEERHRLVGMLRGYDLRSLNFRSDLEWRNFLSRTGRSHALDSLAVLRAEALRKNRQDDLQGLARAREILDSGVALEVRDLAINGKRVMAESSAKGRVVGQVLEGLLQAVLDEPARNTVEELVPLAKSLAADSAPNDA